MTRLGTCYHIDKTDFLELYRLAKQELITSVNIQKAWAATGLSPFEPQVVLKHFLSVDQEPDPKQCEQYNITIRPTIPPEAFFSYIGKDRETQVAITPANTLEVHRLLRLGRKQDIEQENVLEKVSKACCFAMTERTIHSTCLPERRRWRKRNINPCS